MTEAQGSNAAEIHRGMCKVYGEIFMGTAKCGNSVGTLMLDAQMFMM